MNCMKRQQQKGYLKIQWPIGITCHITLSQKILNLNYKCAYIYAFALLNSNQSHKCNKSSSRSQDPISTALGAHCTGRGACYARQSDNFMNYSKCLACLPLSLLLLLLLPRWAPQVSTCNGCARILVFGVSCGQGAWSAPPPAGLLLSHLDLECMVEDFASYLCGLRLVSCQHLAAVHWQWTLVWSWFKPAFGQDIFSTPLACYICAERQAALIIQCCWFQMQ